ncbi:Ni/Fe-hydrogenase, b-type cytochrome subunit [Xinfangfangia pollutisoli]|uniref:Ni/Fe-hydrogenase, b-type cytochrome subunit n=1 Tax=Xinfangfangia pollutisoli TaxID=2865960 RepID=UPI001CD67D1F|nr:Ni/Fe-hydrogenase, b-type cytochrome subunit [Xinfangfangia pollutisoli]
MASPTTNIAAHDLAPEDVATVSRQTSVYVYEAPVRIWHWINAAAILTLCVTGYFIGSPPPSMQIAEATHQFVFGYIRFAHFAAGMVLTFGFLGRIYWAFVGNHHARQLFYIPFWKAEYWRELFDEIQWYLFLKSEPKKYVGHNPLAQLAMFFFITLGVSFMIVTGLALYAEGAQEGSLTHDLFGWVHSLTWNSQRLHTLHHLGMWWIVIFMIVHIYVAIREDIMSRQSIVSTMISGHRTFKDDRPD